MVHQIFHSPHYGADDADGEWRSTGTRLGRVLALDDRLRWEPLGSQHRQGGTFQIYRHRYNRANSKFKCILRIHCEQLCALFQISNHFPRTSATDRLWKLGEKPQRARDFVQQHSYRHSGARTVRHSRGV